MISIDGVLIASVVLLGVVALHQHRILRRLQKTAGDLSRVTELGTRTALAVGRALAVERADSMLGGEARPGGLPTEPRGAEAEDVVLSLLFAGQPTGFYIEVGALDGVRYSVSYYFEAIGWTGLLIEAMPGPARACEMNRPNSRVVHAALSRRGSSGTASFTVLSRDGVERADSYLPGVGRRERRRKAGDRGAETARVPLRTMDDVLEGHEGSIDFAVIDVEGAEADVLDGFDLETRRPRVLIVEDLQMQGLSDVARSITSRGYAHVARLGRNRLFVSEREPDLIRRARVLLSHT